MKYLLSENEYHDLVPRRELIVQEEALKVARRRIVSDEGCNLIRNTGYCTDCPIGSMKDDVILHAICDREKAWGK